jgi:hypothetical protein
MIDSQHASCRHLWVRVALVVPLDIEQLMDDRFLEQAKIARPIEPPTRNIGQICTRCAHMRIERQQPLKRSEG